ncbi:hypothetical protein DAEQUDRAFT_738832 [Daedalea quercina L-15889]|uniref:Uncharacterized protein n=1 Tax=Daedalea quercina L-15889 TaxID=1314783 RepID=A0A165PJ42_9APHY|nr:hypothetical protein DAEQUDRAFT_738832 [Daedalea quercina L-15889]
MLPTDMFVLHFWTQELSPAILQRCVLHSLPLSVLAWDQRTMSSQTFRAKISLGAWADAQALWLSYDISENILAGSSRPLRRYPMDASMAIRMVYEAKLHRPTQYQRLVPSQSTYHFDAA